LREKWISFVVCSWSQAAAELLCVEFSVARLRAGFSGNLIRNREKSKLELQAELHGAGSVCPLGVKESVASPATWRSRGEPRALIPVATDRIAGGVAFVGIVDDELCVVKKVERFDTKLQKPCLGAKGEVPQQGDVKVGPAGVIQGVATSRALGETSGSGKHAGVSQ
jgi:hypothetical protein